MARRRPIRRRRRRSDLAHAPSIAGFCHRHDISRSTYINLRKRGLGPVEVQPIPGGKVTITPENEQAYDRRHAKHAAPEAAE
jgi:hypothetical protein